MSPERRIGESSDFSIPSTELPSSSEEMAVLPSLEKESEVLENEEQPEKTGKSSVLESISSVSKKDLSSYAKLLAGKIETIPNDDCVLLLVNLMKRFVLEEANETAVEQSGRNRGRTKLAAEFEEFQSSQDIEKQTLRYMVEMLVDEWVRATGRHLTDPESSRQVNEAIRTIRGDMKTGWFKRIFRGKLSETEIIKSMESIQMELDEMREKLKKAKLQESEIVRDSLTVTEKAHKEARQIEINAANKAGQLIGEAKKEARDIILEARQKSEDLEASAEKKAQKAEERVNLAKLEEERLRTIIAELKSNPDVAKIYEAKFNKEEFFRKFKRAILFLKADMRHTENYYHKKIQNILDSFVALTNEEKSAIIYDIWLETGGKINPGESNFWSAALTEKLNPVEKEIPLEEQYESQIILLEQSGFLETLSNDQKGIKAMDKNGQMTIECPIPTSEEIMERLMSPEKQEIFKKKIEQGFTKLLIIPFGLPLSQFTEAYKKALQTHFDQGKLLYTKKKPNDPDQPIIESNKDGPMYVWDKYQNADTTGDLVYEPKEFTDNHQGKTKSEIVAQKGGWQVLLIENMPNIPRQGKAKEQGGRKQIDTKGTTIAKYIEKDKKGNFKIPSSKEYLKAIQTESQNQASPYYQEQPMTPEAQLLYALNHLEETNEVIDDHKGNGSSSYQLGAYFTSSGFVPYAYWSRDAHQFIVNRNDAGCRGDVYGVRSAVEVY